MRIRLSPPQIASLLSLLLHLVAVAVYLLSVAPLPIGEIFTWHFFILISLSALCSIAIGLYHQVEYRVWMLLTQFFLFYLIGYPQGENLGVEFPLLIALCVESAFILPSSWNGIVSFLFICGFMIFQGETTAFNTLVNAPEPGPLLSFTAGAITIAFFSLWIQKMITARKTLVEKVQRLDLAISRLSNANLGFQTYADSVKSESVVSERQRVSREIHDTVGYSLTNIMMMLEAASFLLESDPARVNRLITQSREEAQVCIQETRSVMRQLRSMEDEEVKGIRAIAHLAEAFQNATGIHISFEFTNVPDTLGETLDLVLFRFVQEGLTNAFKHGMATGIFIHFWEYNGLINAQIRDNGCGMDEISEGIGTMGMRERIVEVGGTFTRKNVPDGFEISAIVPLIGESNGANPASAG